MPQALKVLLLSNDRRFAAHIARTLRTLGHELSTLLVSVEPGEINRARAHVVLLDWRHNDAARSFSMLVPWVAPVPAIAIIGPDDEVGAAAALRLGTAAIVESPLSAPMLRVALATAMARADNAAAVGNVHHLRWLQEGPRAMALAGSFDEILQLAADHVQYGLGFDRLGIALMDEKSNTLRDWLNTDASGKRYIRENSEVSLAADSTFWQWPGLVAILREGKEYYYSAHALKNTPTEFHGKLEGLEGEHLIVPLRLGTRVLGWIAVDNLLSGKPIGPEDAPTLVAFAREVAVALDKVQLHRAAERLAQEFAALAEVSIAVANQRDPKAVCRAAVDQLAQRFGYELVSVYMREGNRLVCQAVHGYTFPYQIIGEAGVIARTIRLGTAQFVPDTSTDPDYLAAEGRAVAELCVPIVIDDRAVGAINVETFRRGILDLQTEELLVQLARHVAVALRNARLHTEARRHLASMDWLQGITREIARCETVDDVLTRASMGIEEGMGFLVGVALVDDVCRGLRPWRRGRGGVAAAGAPPDAADAPTISEVEALRYAPLRQVLVEGADFALVEKQPLDSPDPFQITSRVGRHLLVALRSGPHGNRPDASVHGIMRLDIPAGRDYDPVLAPVVVAFANHVATALERARLLEAERRRARIAEALERATAAISFSLEPVEMYQQVLGALKEVLDFDSATVIHFSDGMCRPDVNNTRYNVFGDLGRVFPLASDPIFSAWIAQDRREPELIPDTDVDPRWDYFRQEIPQFAAAVQCYLGTPLVIDGEIVGALTLGNRKPYSMDTTAISATAEFAERFSRALRNARLYQMERAANTRLQAVMSLQDEFVATVSHELRTPLTSIIGFSENLITHWDKVDERRRRASVEKIQRAGTRLDRLVRDLLYVSRVDSGNLSLSTALQPILPLVRQATEELAIKFPGQTVTVGRELQSVSVWVDADRFRQVIGNLLDNAAKYSPEGSPIEIGWERNGAWGTLAVHDRGPGIAADNLPKLFTRFGKLDNVTRDGHIGTGLGLYICKQLMENMGGRVWYEPLGGHDGMGSTFRVMMPLSAATATLADPDDADLLLDG